MGDAGGGQREIEAEGKKRRQKGMKKGIKMKKGKKRRKRNRDIGEKRQGEGDRDKERMQNGDKE